LVAGSGPIIIGQAAEFDYAGVQACRALREENVRVILVNSNPATIMTDPEMADAVYLEPLTPAYVEAIIERERPDAMLATLGGQTALNLAVALAERGTLERFGVKLLGTPLLTIQLAEDRKLFKEAMQQLGEPVPHSAIVTNVDEAKTFAHKAGYPLIVRPAYTLGGTGGGAVHDESELEYIVKTGLAASIIHQVLLESSLLGWKEIEYEVLRDAGDNCITICNMENIDAVGVHTGDSIVVAPSQTLSDRDYQRLRTSAINIIRFLKIEGGCNIQFALDPHSDAYQIIEVNPRVSRSSALASKATGYPIAKIATKIALGHRLPDLPNPVTGVTKAAFEPTLDYCVVKIPRWPFDKFPLADSRLGTQMKSTGEVMAIGRTFSEALLKAVRGLDIGRDTLTGGPYAQWSDDELDDVLRAPTHERLFVVAECLRRGREPEAISKLTAIDAFWLWEIRELVEMEMQLNGNGSKDPLLQRPLLQKPGLVQKNGKHPSALFAQAKRLGYADSTIARLSGTALGAVRSQLPATAQTAYKMVDTAAAEFPAQSPYYYATVGEEEELRRPPGRSVVVVGSGPIRIGQGIEFDYSCVHAAWALHDAGVAAVMVNNNPETVSTDFDISDVLIFEPPCADEVEHAVRATGADGTLLIFGGQTPINLARELEARGVPVLGTSRRALDLAEDRKKFDAVLARLGVARPQGQTARSFRKAREIARSIGFPVLVRPSYVLGGRGMEIVYNEAQLAAYAESAAPIMPGAPLLVDKYVVGAEVEVDAVYDGENICIPGIFEHVERAGIHSGDSMAVYPPQNITPAMQQRITDVTHRLAAELGIRGLINVQYIVKDDDLFVIEANPRASRTVPIIAKLTGVPLVAAAVAVALGKKLTDIGIPTGLLPEPDFVAVKAPVFSFSKLRRIETMLGPEMKSTGEVLGIDTTYAGALLRGLVASGLALPPPGGRILLSIADEEKGAALPIARAFAEMDYTLFATPGTWQYLRDHDISSNRVNKIAEGSPHVVDLIAEGGVDLVINNVAANSVAQSDGYRIRHAALEGGVACLTSLDTVRALVLALEARVERPIEVRSLQEYVRQRSAQGRPLQTTIGTI
ncbi:MAG TPA: carbamoyl-phosphate synthase large subunit, partial [Candidatus Eremiobacteraceae bacterium]|nr:carbamoyl-phosphate synthase large subunit [Candidatus Eremiobacteraceae bacterium]